MYVTYIMKTYYLDDSALVFELGRAVWSFKRPWCLIAHPISNEAMFLLLPQISETVDNSKPYTCCGATWQSFKKKIVVLCTLAGSGQQRKLFGKAGTENTRLIAPRGDSKNTDSAVYHSCCLLPFPKCFLFCPFSVSVAWQREASHECDKGAFENHK